MHGFKNRNKWKYLCSRKWWSVKISKNRSYKSPRFIAGKDVLVSRTYSRSSFRKNIFDYEIILVNDFSKDGASTIEEMAGRNKILLP